jgi:putative peptide zinc metalloprotease protein
MSEAKLELLIRKPDGDRHGFNIKRIPSGLVYAGYRPKRIDEDGFEVRGEVSPADGRTHYVLSARDTRKYLSLNEREYFLWGLMDGSKSIKDIASAYFFQFGSLDFSAIRTLLTRLKETGLVEFVPASRLRVAMDRSRHPLVRMVRDWLGKVDYRIDDADGWVSRLYDGGGYLLVNKYAMTAYLALSAIGLTAMGRSVGELPLMLFHEHPVLVIAILLLSFYPIAAVHEIFHALACKRYGRKVHAFGFTLWDGFYPSFYTDVSDIYLSPRPERLFVSLAGPLSTAAIAAACFIPVAVFPDAPWVEYFYEVGRLNLAVAAISLYPFQFIKMDGYYLLVDLLGMPGLRERSSAFIKGLPEFVGSGKPFTRAEAVLVAYFTLSLLSIAGLAAYILL